MSLNMTIQTQSSIPEQSESITEENRDEPEKDSTDFDKCLISKELGSCRVPVHHLTLASDNKRIRPIDQNYVTKITKTSKDSGINFTFPEAIGNVDTDIEDFDTIKELIDNGELVVEIIDGNHTTQAMKALLDEFPEDQSLQTRHVRIYRNLTRPEALKLGIKGNEIASQANPTAEFDIIRIIRQELNSCFDGIVTQAFRRHVDTILDVKEDVSKQKRASELIKMASMEEECWDILQDIYVKYPRQKPYICNDVCQLNKEQALPLLEKVAEGTIKPAALPYYAKSLPLPPADTPLIVQVGRKKEKKDRTKQQLKRVPSKTSPQTASKEIVKIKGRVEELEKEFAFKSHKIQELELQLARERLEVNHFKEVAQMIDRTIKMLEETTSVLKDKIKMKETERDSRPLNMDSLPFRLNFSSLPDHASERYEVMTQPLNTQIHQETKPTAKKQRVVTPSQKTKERSIDAETAPKKTKQPAQQSKKKRIIEKATNEIEKMNANEDIEFEVGDRVWALWGDEYYPDKYKAKVIDKTESTYKVLFDDKAKKTFNRPVSSDQILLLTPESLEKAV